MNSYSWTRRLFMQIVFMKLLSEFIASYLLRGAKPSIAIALIIRSLSIFLLSLFYLSLSIFSKYVFMIARSYVEVAGATSQPDCSPTQRLPSEDEEDEEEEPPKPEVRENGPSWRVSISSLLWFLSHAIWVEINLDLVSPLWKINYRFQCFSLIRMKNRKQTLKSTT